MIEGGHNVRCLGAFGKHSSGGRWKMWLPGRMPMFHWYLYNLPMVNRYTVDRWMDGWIDG